MADVVKHMETTLKQEVFDKREEGNDTDLVARVLGAVFANESYLIVGQSEEGSPRMVKEYKKHFGAGCSKALSCQTVCPVGIETLTSILRMNRK